jgi:adenosylhomocysteine nucleosidase
MWRFLLQNWLRQKVQRTVLDAAQKELAAAVSSASSGSEPVACDFALVFALAIESGGLVDLLGDVKTTRGNGMVVRQGQRHQRRIILAECGAGREKAAAAAHALIDAHRPRWLFAAGFAGALVPDLQHGQIVVADRIADATGREWAADPHTIPPWLSEVRGVRVGKLVTADSVVRLPEEKLALGRQHGAIAVDMESLAVAEVCAQRGVPFLAVRAISDTLDEQLPPDVERLLNQKSNARRFGAALGSILQRPGSVKDLWRLKENAMRASDRLARFISGVVKHL